MKLNLFLLSIFGVPEASLYSPLFEKHIRTIAISFFLESHMMSQPANPDLLDLRIRIVNHTVCGMVV
jgi:hypothetical protein